MLICKIVLHSSLTSRLTINGVNKVIETIEKNKHLLAADSVQIGSTVKRDFLYWIWYSYIVYLVCLCLCLCVYKTERCLDTNRNYLKQVHKEFAYLTLPWLDDRMSLVAVGCSQFTNVATDATHIQARKKHLSPRSAMPSSSTKS